MVFYDAAGNQNPLAGIDSEGRIYADAIKGGTIEAVNIKTCLIEGALTVGTTGGSMKYHCVTFYQKHIQIISCNIIFQCINFQNVSHN